MRVAALAGLLSIAGVAFPAAAQRTADQATLVFSAGVGWVSGTDLWSVSGQTIVGEPDPFSLTGEPFLDQIGIVREIRNNFGVFLSGTYFPWGAVGFVAEGTLLGLGYKDACRLESASLSTTNPSRCASLNGRTTSGTGVLVSAGPVVRFASRKVISPYLRAGIGPFFPTQSSIRTQSFNPDGSVFTVYEDEDPRNVSVGYILGAGLTTNIAPGYQLRLEVRDNIVGLDRVTGVTRVDGETPPHELSYKSLWSVSLGFDVVLERRRGRRY